MSKVGIIANPASGKDIRRLVAYASIMDNMEKVNQVRRIILGIDSTGVDEILIMPDSYGLGFCAMEGLKSGEIRAKVCILDMIMTCTEEDSIAAAEIMKELGAGCIVTLGGDGTNRAVAKANSSVPLVPVSTGTNNVFPLMVEPTTAGMAAGVVARRIVDFEDVVRTHKRLIIVKNGLEIDMALIDAVVLDQPFLGSRAVWKLSEIRQIVCTRADPGNMGLTSIGGSLHPIGPEDKRGMHMKLGGGSLRVRAAVLPGLIREVAVQEVRIIEPGEEIEVIYKPSVIALDGEREVTVRPSDEVRIRLQTDGPNVVDIDRALLRAAEQGFFRSNSG